MQKLLIAASQTKDNKVVSRGLAFAKALDLRCEVVVFAYASLKGVGSVLPKKSSAQAKKQLLRKRVDAVKLQVEKALGSAKGVMIRGVWAKKPETWLVDYLGKHPEDYYAVVKTAAQNTADTQSMRNWHVLRHAPVPVMLVAHQRWRRTHSVMAAVDLASSSRDKQAMNEAIISRGKAIADALGVPFYAVSAIVVPTILDELDMIDVRAYAREMKTKLAPRVTRLARKYGLSEKQFVIKRGDADKVITSVAADKKAQLVVMGTAGRSGLRAMVLGNTAEEILVHLHTDILALKA